MGEKGHVVLDLQRFAEGGPSSVTPGGAAPSPQGEGMGNGSGGVDTGAAAAQGLSPYQQMVQGQYRQEYEQDVGNRVQKAIQKRFRNQQDYKAQVDGMTPIVELAAQTYHLDPSDMNGIYQKMADDIRLVQEDADKNGISPEMQRNLNKLEAENRRKQKQIDRFTEQGRQEAENRRIAMQAVELHQKFPNFDLMTELQNPDFERMIRQSGLSVENAFWAIHGPEIQRGSMQYAAQQTQRNIAASVQAGASRPLENGMQRQNPVNMGVDIAHMDKKTREAYRQRIKNGEKIDFQNNV